MRYFKTQSYLVLFREVTGGQSQVLSGDQIR